MDQTQFVMPWGIIAIILTIMVIFWGACLAIFPIYGV